MFFLRNKSENVATVVNLDRICFFMWGSTLPQFCTSLLKRLFAIGHWILFGFRHFFGWFFAKEAGNRAKFNNFYVFSSTCRMLVSAGTAPLCFNAFSFYNKTVYRSHIFFQLRSDTVSICVFIAKESWRLSFVSGFRRISGAGNLLCWNLVCPVTIIVSSLSVRLKWTTRWRSWHIGFLRTILENRKFSRFCP